MTAIVGPRQCGKTTLARQLAAAVGGETTWFDLEDPIDLQQLSAPMLALGSLRGLVVIDEIQRQPELFALLRVLVDRQAPVKFLVLGSASPQLIRGVSESLAGRVETLELSDLSLAETGNQARLWLRGGFPRAYLAASDADSRAWCESFVKTFLERDVAMMGPRTSQPMMRRFWALLATYHGQIWNSAVLARALGVSDHTTRHYVDLLTETFMVRQLDPWWENAGKRVVRAPKVYIRDSGLLHALLGTTSQQDLLKHTKVGASWEGFALEQTLHACHGEPYFWAVHGGGEVDLILHRPGERLGFEFKYTDAPRLTKSMHTGLADLQLGHLYVIYPGHKQYVLSPQVTALPLSEIGVVG